MKQKTVNLYEYSELSPKAKEKALDDHRVNGFDDYGLKVALDNSLDDLLKKHKITPTEDIKGYPTKHATLYYSLSNCQGDGVMFEGRFTWKSYRIIARHQGRYYHAHSKELSIFRADDDQEAPQEIYDAFNDVYISICKQLEKEGYSHIDELESEDYFIDLCNANEYTFREDGTMENA